VCLVSAVYVVSPATDWSHLPRNPTGCVCLNVCYLDLYSGGLRTISVEALKKITKSLYRLITAKSVWFLYEKSDLYLFRDFSHKHEFVAMHCHFSSININIYYCYWPNK